MNSGLFDQEVLQHKAVHFTFRECVERIGRGVDDGFAFQIERGVEQDGDAGGLTKALDQTVIARALIAEDRLEAACAIHVRDGRQNLALIFLHGDDVKHVASRMVALRLKKIEVFARALGEN